MARLLTLADFVWGGSGGEDPSWWFPDAQYGSSLPFNYSAVFPHARGIHQSIIGKGDRYSVEQKQQALRVKIRKFVERNCVGNALWTWTGESMYYNFIREVDEETLAMTKKSKRYTSESDKYRLVEIEHGYLVFHFEEEVDSGLFKIAFGEHITAISDRHPKYTDVTEEQIAFAKEGYNVHYKTYRDWVYT